MMIVEVTQARDREKFCAIPHFNSSNVPLEEKDCIQTSRFNFTKAW